MLIEITADSYDIELDLVYATARNFTSQPVYKNARCYLHPDAAACLQRSISLARGLGLRLKVFDAFRPSEAQWLLWEHSPNPDFLADPERGSPHSMGVAIDLTLINNQGQELDMGTPFDSFSPRAFHGDKAIPSQAQKNRMLLLGLMTCAGWDFFKNEWWHYQLHNARAQYAIMSDNDIPKSMMY
jgi:D-alanyl-D-alanine dipeptidase